MKPLLKLIAFVFVLSILGLLAYGGYGYWDAVRESEKHIRKAESLIANGQGSDDLGAKHIKQLILVEDPGFWEHSGIDLLTAGAGLTTITQSLAKRLGFSKFEPGLGKIRQTGFALGLESRLSKKQILALFLETVEMGKGPNGWMTGFFTASNKIYSKPPSELTDDEFLKLVAVMISPAVYDLRADDKKLSERVRRISKLVAGDCAPTGLQDVWLKGCS
jgi:membrane peptidoglycan carboxypeptidase